MEPVFTRECAAWLPRSAARPLLAWPELQYEALATALERALVQWRGAWGITEPVTSVTCEAASSSAVIADNWHALGSGAWLQVPTDANACLAQLLFGTHDTGSPIGSPIAAEVIEACAREGRRCLFTALHLSDMDPERSAPLPGLGLAWSGAVQASLPGTPGWRLLVGPEAMQAWLKHAGFSTQEKWTRAELEPLSSAAEALGAQTLLLNVQLSGCELVLGHLQALQLGDVVRLKHALDLPARLTDGDGNAVLEAFLGAHQGRKAVELTKPQTH